MAEKEYIEREATTFPAYFKEPVKEYFEREALICVVEKWLSHVFGIRKTDEATTIFKRLHSIPAANVREIVYCEYCKFAPTGECNGKDLGFGLEWPSESEYYENPCPFKCDDGWYSKKPAPDFYCAYGKRKEERNE